MEPARLLRDLIALPSVNPAFLPPGDSRAGEHHVCELLSCLAARLGLAVERQNVLSKRQNLLARLTPVGKVRQRVLLVPHMDTVGGTDGQLVPRAKHGRIYGRGACDTKGSIAAMLSALATVAKGASRPRATEIVLVAVVDEENEQQGSRALVASRLRADLAIVGEPTRGRVVTAHKGDLWLRLETHGKAAHGATPHRGRNAVHQMANVVDLLETEYAAALRQRQHSLLGHATINVGSISGGQQPNIVPDYCVIEADRRTLPGETEAGVRREIRGLLARRGLQAHIANRKSAPCLPMATDPDLPLVRQLMQVVRQRQPAGVNYFCDASVLAQGGIPSVVFGPGDIAQAHTADEWVSLTSLTRTTRALTRFLQSLP